MHVPLLLALSACSNKDAPVDGTVHTDDSGGGYPSGYTSGQYRLTAFTVLGDGAGKDWDGDGDPDNKLPNVLQAFDFVLGGFDLSKDGLNVLAADAIQNDTLVVLVDATYSQQDLALDFLAGTVDDGGSLHVDLAQSYDAKGNPISHMEGTFVGATSYTAGPDPIVVSIPVDTNGTPAPFPLEEVVMTGDLGAIDLDGTMAGMLPVDRFVSDVLPIFIPKQGYDIDGDQKIDPETESQKAIMGFVTTLLDTSADVQTEDGRPAISAAFHFAAGAATF